MQKLHVTIEKGTPHACLVNPKYESIST
jgi:hypothetical protein